MRDALITTLTLVGATLTVGPALGDTLESTRDQPIREVAHSVDVELDDGVATYTVRRSFLNEGDRADQAYLEIRLPEGAAATGLRIRAKGTWYDGELMQRERARGLYEELTGVGPHEPKDPALLEWASTDRLRMHIFPVFAGATTTVEYTLRAPTAYRDGAYHLAYPEPTDSKAFADPVVTVRPPTPGAAIRVDDRRIPPGQPTALSAGNPDRADPERVDPACRGLDVRERASCASVPARISASPDRPRLETDVEIDHPNPDNIRPRVVTPSGHSFDLEMRSDDGPAVFELDRGLSEDIATEGTWRLFVSDFLHGNDGSIERWNLSLDDGTMAVSATGDGLPVDVPDSDPQRQETGARDASTSIRVGAEFDRTLRARLGRVRAGPDTAFTRFEAEVAPRLSELPEDANFAFLVDASHSVSERRLDAQLDLARGMLHHVPEAEFTVVAYRRFATQIGRGFGSADRADEILSNARNDGFFERRNGSHLDRAMISGAQKLSDRAGPRYLVALTDRRLRWEWSSDLADRALRSLPDSSTVHVVEPRPAAHGGPRLERTDDDPLAEIALDRGGIMATFYATPSDPAEARNRAALHLVRPTRLENLAFRSIDLSNPPDKLDEGEGLREMLSGGTAPHRVTVTGSIWADSYRQTVRVTRPFSRATAGFVFSKGMYDALDADQMERVARFGRAVSPVTSYLAIEPGVRPSEIGIDRTGMRGIGSGGGAGFGGVDPANSDVTYFDVADHLRPKFESCLDHDPEDAWRAEITVETTDHEIVDIGIEREGPDAPELESCLTETAWGTDLPHHETYRDHDEFEVVVAKAPGQRNPRR